MFRTPALPRTCDTIALSPDGRWLAVSFEWGNAQTNEADRVIAFNLETGARSVTEIPARRGRAHALAFLPGERLLTGCFSCFRDLHRQ